MSGCLLPKTEPVPKPATLNLPCDNSRQQCDEGRSTARAGTASVSAFGLLRLQAAPCTLHVKRARDRHVICSALWYCYGLPMILG